MNKCISVVIPFYNAREYVSQAVQSALEQPETGEVILIEDGSPDGGLEVCQELCRKNTNVRLVQHADGMNHGAAASRNLGIKVARFPFIAFLDADDYYLPNRFSRTMEVFSEHSDADGVYEAIGTYFQNPIVEKLYKEVGLPELTTIREKIEPGMLFVRLMKGGVGFFSFDGFTVKLRAFDKTGFFNEELTMYEDTYLVYQLSAKSTLFPGNIDIPVCMRRVHENNRITYRLRDKRKTYETMMIFWNSLLKWGESELTREQFVWLVRRYISHLRAVDYIEDCMPREILQSRIQMIGTAKKAPSLFASLYFWRRIIPSSVCMRNLVSNWLDL